MNEPAGDLAQEPAGQFVPRSSVERAGAGVRQVEAVSGAGHAHIAEAPLFFQALFVERAGVWEEPLLHAGYEYHRKLEALGVVKGHERDDGLPLMKAVDIRVEAYLLQEVGDVPIGIHAIELLRHPDELLQVF